MNQSQIYKQTIDRIKLNIKKLHNRNQKRMLVRANTHPHLIKHQCHRQLIHTKKPVL